MASDARDVQIVIGATDKTPKAADSAARNMERVERAAKKQQSTFDKVVSDWGRGISSIQKKMDGWASSGNSAARKFTKGVSAGLGGLIKLGGSIGASLSSAIQSAGPHVQAAMVAVLAAAALAAAPAIGGAIVGGAATGGIIGGLMIASSDVRVKSAFDRIKERATQSLQAAAQSFVPATIDAVGRAELALQGILPSIQSIFQKSSRYVGPLVTALGQAGKYLAQGIDRAMDAAGPVMRQIMEGIQRIAAVTGEAFASLGDNGEAMALGLRVIFATVEQSIRAVGWVVNALTETFEFFVKMMPGGQRLLKSMSSGADETTNSFQGLANGFIEAADSAEKNTQALSKLQQQQEELVGSNLSWDEAQIRSREATKSATAAIKENGRAKSLNTQAGRENRQELINMATAFNQEMAAAIRAGAASDQTSAAYKRNRAALESAARMAGYNRQEIAAMVARYLTVPSTITTEVRLSGVQNALRNIENLKRKAASFGVGGQGYGQEARDNMYRYGKPGSGGGLASSDSWVPSDGTGGRTAQSVAVTSDVNVFLDGAPFRSMVTRTVNSARADSEWRARVGRRDASWRLA